jgi:hypothetical protein
MWDLDTIVRLNDEAQRRADAIREQEARERQADDPAHVSTAVTSTTERQSCRPSQASPSR